jgi:collagen type III alpha
MIDRAFEADADGDGKLSKEEAPERMRENFDRIDADKDGSVSKEELTAAFARMREAGPRGPREGGERGPREGGGRGPAPGESPEL